MARGFKKDGSSERFWNETLPWIIPLAAILLVGGLIRLINVNKIMFFGDESLYQVRICYQSLSFALNHPQGSLLFSFLINQLLPLGELELMARLPSLVSGILAIAAVYFLGSALFSKTEGLIAATFTALSPILILYSQHSRAYAVFLLFSVLALLAFYRALVTEKTKLWVVFFVLAIVGSFNHNFTFFSLTAFWIFLGSEWFRDGRRISKRLGKALIWTASASAIAFLLNMLDPDFRARIVMGILEETAGSFPSLLAIDDILRTQIAPGSRSGFFYFAFLGMAAAGMVAGLRKTFQVTLLLLFHIIVPYILFILIRPRESFIPGAYRYLIFYLPVLFLFAARGITSAASLFASGKKRGSGLKPRPAAAQTFFSIVAALSLAAGIGMFFKNHYVEFWRLGAFKPAKEIHHFLRRNVKSDALIYFDVFPASHLISIINPLDRRMKPEEISFSIRTGYRVGAGENEYLLYRIYKMEYEKHVSFHNADVWAVLPAEAVCPGLLLAKADEASEFEAFPLEMWTILHFNSPETNIRMKLAQLAALLLELPAEPHRTRHYHLLAAKTFLTVYDAEVAYRQLEAFQSIPMDSPGGDFGPNPVVYRILDAVFGLNPRKVKTIGEETILAEIRHLIFQFGNLYAEKGETEKALKAYEKCSQMGDDFDFRIANRILGLAKRVISEENSKVAAPLLENALHFDPSRKDIRLLLAETYQRLGRTRDAVDLYQAVFDAVELPDGFYAAANEEGSPVVIWGGKTVRYALFRGRNGGADRETVYKGGFAADRKIRAVEDIAFEHRDIVSFIKNRGKLELRVKPGYAKALTLKIPSKSRVNWDIRINGRRDSSRIVFLNEMDPFPSSVH